MPPHCRSHRAPTTMDTSATAAASALPGPCAIARQNGHRAARCKTGGRPGDRSYARRILLDVLFFSSIITSVREVLQRWVELTRYPSIKYSERLTEAGTEPSVGGVGDSCDNALAETIIGLFQTEAIDHREPWRSMDAVEYATLEWVDWSVRAQLEKDCRADRGPEALVADDARQALAQNGARAGDPSCVDALDGADPICQRRPHRDRQQRSRALDSGPRARAQG